MAVHKPLLLLFFLMTSGLLFLSTHGQLVGVGGRSKMSRVLGIHLGNMYSSVAVYKHPEADNMDHCSPGEPTNCGASSFYETIEVAVNEHNTTTIPSCVSFTESGVLVGEAAKVQEAVHPQRTVCGINRLIAKRFDNPEVQSYIKTLPYKVVNKDNKPYIQIEFNDGVIKLYSPKEICAMILGKMKEIAEKHMGSEYSFAAIIIHESYYDRYVKQEINDAGSMTGLDRPFVGHTRCALELVKGLYWYKGEFKALIFHLGGSMFITEIAHMHSTGWSDVISTREDPNLGGKVFDTRLVDYFVELIKNKYGKDISNDSNALRELRVECERAKISLSEIDRVIVKTELRLVDDETLVIEEALTREKFEELNMDLFNRTINMVKSVLKEGKVNTTDIEIILLGRSTNIPMIQHLIKSYIGKEPLSLVKPKDALVFAAIAQASLVTRRSEPLLRAATSPISLGIETIGGKMSRFLDVFSLVPGSRTRNVTTYYDGQTTMVIKVFEGQRWLTKYCHHLGNLQISNLPSAPRGEMKVEVTLELHEDGGVTVTAEHRATQNRESMVIPKEERNITEQLIKDHFEFKKNSSPDVEALTNIHNFYRLNPPQPRSMGFAVVI